MLYFLHKLLDYSLALDLWPPKRISIFSIKMFEKYFFIISFVSSIDKNNLGSHFELHFRDKRSLLCEWTPYLKLYFHRSKVIWFWSKKQYFESILLITTIINTLIRFFPQINQNCVKWVLKCRKKQESGKRREEFIPLIVGNLQNSLSKF